MPGGAIGRGGIILRGDRDLHLVVVAVPMDQAFEEAQGARGRGKAPPRAPRGARVEEVSLGLS